MGCVITWFSNGDWYFDTLDQNEKRFRHPNLKGIFAQSNKENEILKYENDISCVNHHEKISAQIKSQNRAINCPLLNSNLKEDECLLLRQEMNNFFTDKQVLQRLKSCDSYFDAIDTAAFHQVGKYTMYSTVFQI